MQKQRQQAWQQANMIIGFHKLNNGHRGESQLWCFHVCVHAWSSQAKVEEVFAVIKQERSTLLDSNRHQQLWMFEAEAMSLPDQQKY